MSKETKSGTSTSADRATLKQLQEAAKWIIATIGAVLAVLVAGLSFSSVGRLEDHWHWGAFSGTALALLGLFSLFMNTIAVLVVKPVTRADLSSLSVTDQTSIDTSFLSPASTAKDLVDQLPGKVEAAESAYQEYLDDPKELTKKLAYQKADREKDWWAQSSDRTIERVRLNRTRSAFDTIKCNLFWQLCLVLGGVCLAAFSLSKTESDSSATSIGVVQRTPTSVLVQFNQPPAEIFSKELGKDCVEAGEPHPATAIGIEGDSYTVVLTPSELCPNPLVVEIGPDDAKVALPPPSG